MHFMRVVLVSFCCVVLLALPDMAAASSIDDSTPVALETLVEPYTIGPEPTQPSTVFQIPPHPAPVYLTPADGFASSDPAIAADGDGNYCIAWVDQKSGNSEIYFMRVTPLGQILSGPLNVSGSPTVSSLTPDIAVDAQSTAHIAWREGSAIYVSRVDRNGVEVLNNLPAATGTCAWPAVAALPTGETWVLFRRTQVTLFYLYVAKVSVAGTVACEQQSAANAIIEVPNYTSIDANPAGDALLTFVDTYNWHKFATYQLWRGNCSGYGNACPSTTRSQVFNSDDISNTSLSTGTASSFYLTFENPSGGNRKVFSLTGCFTAALISDTAGPSQAPVVATPEGVNGAYVVWEERSGGTPTIRVRPVDLSSASHVISNSSGSCTAPDISMAARDQWAAVWQEYGGVSTEIQFSSALLEGQGVEITVRTHTTGEPVSDSLVELRNSNGSPVRTLRSNSRGMAWVSDLQVGRYSGQAAFGGEKGPLVPFAIAESEWVGAELRVPTDIGIHGRVEDGYNHLPIGGATVRLLDEGGAEIDSSTTWADGRFWIDVVEPGTYQYEISVAGKAGTRLEGKAPYTKAIGSVTLDPAAGHGLQDLGVVALKSNVVILVHGINSSGSSWASFAASLDSVPSTFTIVSDIDLPGDLLVPLASEVTHGFDHIREQARVLDGVLRDCERGGARSYSIVGHSQGGLVSRYVIEVMRRDETPRVPTLITLGTPHHGSLVASSMAGLAAFFDKATLAAIVIALGGDVFDTLKSVARLHEALPALFDLSPNSPFLIGLNRPDSLVPFDWTGGCHLYTPLLVPTPPLAESNLRATTNYVTLTGTGHSSTTRVAGAAFLFMFNCWSTDGVVPAMSAGLISDAPNDNVFNWTDTQIGRPVEHKAQSAVGFQNDTSVQKWVRDLLTQTRGLEPTAKAASFLDTPSASWVMLDEMVLEVPVGAVRTDTLWVDQADSLSIDWIWLEGDVDLALVDPLGAVIDSVSAIGNPAITYTRDNAAGRGSYVIAAPNSGSWQVRASGSGISAPTATLVVAASTSSVALRVNTERSFSDPSAPTVIRASLFDAGGPLSTGTVATLISPPAGEDYPIGLADDGISPDVTAADGEFAALIPMSAGPGSYQVRVVASGDTPFPFTRTASIAVESPVSSDLRIVNMEVRPSTTLSLGAEVQIVGSLTNAGAEPSRLQLRLSHEQSLTNLVETIIDLGPGETYDINAVHLPLNTGEHRYVLSALPLEGSVDLNLFNNGRNVLVTIGEAVSGVLDEGVSEGRRPIESLPNLHFPIEVFPNPFNPNVRIAYVVNADARVGISVFDVRGRLVRRLFAGDLNPGEHAASWDAKDDMGRSVESGVYFVRVQVGSEVGVRKTMLLK